MSDDDVRVMFNPTVCNPPPCAECQREALSDLRMWADGSVYDLDSQPLVTRETIERALGAYIVCALWSSHDDRDTTGSTMLDDVADVDDVSPEAYDVMLEDVASFLESCWEQGWDLGPIEPEQIGHDLWLTRNGHGAGFWDRGLGQLGDDLTALAKPYGDCNLYVGDDGLVYV